MKIYVIPILRTKFTYYCHATPSHETYLSRASKFASSKWESFGQSEKTSWKGRIFVAGQRLLDRIDYQEYFLKGIPLREEWSSPRNQVPILYPSEFVSPPEIYSNLTQLLHRRLPYHKKYMIYSALFIPLSSTFTIVPLIPNIPFFYNVFRFYSHYKAYKGAQHLHHIIKHNRLSLVPSDLLDQIYADVHLNDNPEHVISEKKIEEIAREFKLPGLEIDVKRARHQILNEIAKEQAAKKSEKDVVVDGGFVEDEKEDKLLDVPFWDDFCHRSFYQWEFPRFYDYKRLPDHREFESLGQGIKKINHSAIHIQILDHLTK
ncbi:hypothetical protein G9A89_015296 [Geosiphon pyriformis]|nr:hypothetical protein G9A89_015296 [Geosiphon pyriformis]